MYYAWLFSRPFISAPLFVAASLVVLASCSVTVSNNGGGATDRFNTGVGDGGTGAWVEFPDDPDILMTIDEDTGIGSAVFHGYDPGGGADVVVTKVEYDTSDGRVDVTVDAERRPTRIDVGALTLQMQHNVDGTFNYQFYNAGQMLFQEARVASEATIAKRTGRTNAAAAGFNFPACAIERMEYWSRRAIIRREGSVHPGEVPGHAFTNCVKSNEPLWNLARAYCVMLQSVRKRLLEVQEAIHANRDHWRDVHSLEKVAVALSVTAIKVLVALDGTATSAANQLWGSQDCSGGGNDPNDAGAEVCGNRICGDGETPANCPTDCGPAEVCGNGTCGAGENVSNCPADCAGTPVCGNGNCEPGENASNCPTDCTSAPVCGNGLCETGETTDNCSVDCGAASPTAASLAGCWALFGDLYDTSTGERTHLDGGMIFQIDPAGRLERLWVRFPEPNPDGILIEELVRFTVANAGILIQAVSTSSSHLSVSSTSAEVTLGYAFTAYMWEAYVPDEGGLVCEVHTEQESDYRFDINDARLIGDPPTQFESDDAVYSVRITLRDDDTGAVTSNAATQAGDVTGSLVDCPNPAQADVESQEEMCPQDGGASSMAGG